LRSSRNVIIVGTTSATVAAVVLWWHVMLSPWNFVYPDDWEPADESVSHPVFVYGTLTMAPVRLLVKGRVGHVEPMTLTGYTRRGLNINPDPEGEIPGLLLEVTADELRRLDRYERLGIRYVRELMTISDGSEAWVYRRLEED